MKLEIVFETHGNAPAGLDLRGLEKDIRAEVIELSAYLSDGNPVEKVTEAPDGAQGEHLLIEWIIDIAKDPAMIPAYIRTFSYAINSLLSPSHERKSEDNRDDKQVSMNFDEKSPKCHLKFLGKTLLLPATVAAIKKFLDEAQG